MSWETYDKVDNAELPKKWVAREIAMPLSAIPPARVNNLSRGARQDSATAPSPRKRPDTLALGTTEI